MAANGQRIHPAGSRQLTTPRHAASRRDDRSTPRANTTPVASASWLARRRPHPRGRGDGARAVARVAHRGAASTDNSGDGAGLLTQIPIGFLSRLLPARAPPAARTAVRCRRVLPSQRSRALASIGDDRAVLAEDGIPVLGWRDVPTNPARSAPRRSRPARSFARYWWDGRR